MTSFHLDKFLSGHVFAFVMIFSRIGSAIMLFPGISESFVPMRSRLTLAFATTLIAMEPLLPRLPAPPETISGLAHCIGYEVIIGLFFGTVLRLLMSTLETTGMVIGLQSGLSNATVFNPSLSAQSPLPSAFLSIVGVTVMFVTGLDHMLFRSLAALYDFFPPNGELMPGDMAQAVIQTMSKSFQVGIELSMPFFIMGLLMYIALGIMQKLMPQVQLFLVLLPVQIWGGLALIAVTVSVIITVWLHYFDETVGSLLSK